MSRVVSLMIAACAILGLASGPALAQPAPKPEDLKSSVPALDAMHEVIMPLWHDAWPNKDVKAMAAMLPDIEKHFAAVNKAELPLILRDKMAAWVTGVDELKQTVAAYKAAVTAGDNEALLEGGREVSTRSTRRWSRSSARS